jgi:CheY-like chemotaxis protein
LFVRGHVLYVEDDDPIRYLYADALRTAGLIVQEQKFAADALEALMRSRPDLILLDLGMPAGLMSGIEMLVRLRTVSEWARIPVVVLSALGDSSIPISWYVSMSPVCCLRPISATTTSSD